MGKTPKKATPQQSKAVTLLRASPNLQEDLGFNSTVEMPAAYVSDACQLSKMSNAQEDSSGILRGEKIQHHRGLEEAGFSTDRNVFLVPRQRRKSGAKRKSDEFRAQTISTENEDHNTDASTSRATTPLFVSPLKKITTEDITRGTSKSKRVFDVAEEAMVPTRNSTFKSPDSASLKKTAEDVNRAEIFRTREAGTSVYFSVAPKQTITPTIFSERNTTRMSRMSPASSVAGMLHSSQSKMHHADERGRQPERGCGESTRTARATSLHSTARSAHSKNAVANREAHDSQPILTQHNTQHWDKARCKSAEKIPFIMTSNMLLEKAPSSSYSDKTDTAQSVTPNDVSRKPLPTHEFQQAPAGNISASYRTDISKLSSGELSDYDGSFPSAYAAVAALPSTNVSAGSPHDVSEQRLGVSDQNHNSASLAERRNAERVRSLYPILASLLDKNSESARCDRSAGASAYDQIPKIPATQPTADAAQPGPTRQLHLQDSVVVSQRTTSPGSDDSVLSLESLSPGQKAAWKSSLEAAQLRWSIRPQGASPYSDDSCPSLESLSPEQKAAWKLSQEAARAHQELRPQNDSQVSYESAPSLEPLSPGQKVLCKLIDVAFESQISSGTQITSSASKNSAHYLKIPHQQLDGRNGKNLPTSRQEFAFDRVEQREINSLNSETLVWKRQPITAQNTETRATSKRVGPQDWPGTHQIEQVKFSPERHPLTLLQKSNLAAKQRASASEPLHQGMVEHLTVPTIEEDSLLSNTLPVRDVFTRKKRTQEVLPAKPLHSMSVQTSVMSHFPGKNAPNTKSREATNTEINAAGFSHKHTLHLPEIPKYATPEIPFPEPLHFAVEHMPQYPLATPRSELPPSGYHGGIHNSLENHPVTAPLQSDTQPVQRRMPFDIPVSVAPNFPPAHVASAYFTLKDFKQQNARKVQSQNPSSSSHLEASHELPCHE
ncbi:hypothetical protein HPB51_011487 [Rhipicephalus microplus]|uniref:Uncharacterized protein n=1 Tax=Rhipicephalus microplus TaxID=6941 RepID=A0A9J6E8V3_RHIMP|nr:hypothetical protein HPB51_011487 [Rhipicephalus microplus]